MRKQKIAITFLFALICCGSLPLFAQTSGVKMLPATDCGVNGEPVRFASDANGKQIAIECIAKDGTLFWPKAQLSSNVSERIKGFVNAVTDCGVPDDKVSDSCAKMTACIANNPGKIIGLPLLVNPGSGGGTPTPQSYYSSCTWTLNSNGTELRGLSGLTRYLGGVRVKFAPGVGGVKIGNTTDSSCSSCAVSHLWLEGGDALPLNTDSIYYEDWPSITALTGDGPDGLQVNVGNATVDGVRTTQFKRHGVLVNGNAFGQPDLWRITNLFTDNNRGCGLMIYGQDSNVGFASTIDSRSNLYCAYRDSSWFGTSFVVTHSSGNGRTSTLSAGGAVAVASESVTSNVKTITTSSSHGWSIGKWVNTSGETDGTFAGTCKLLSVPTTTTATCNFTHADGSTTGGTSHTASGAEIGTYYASATGIGMGNYLSNTSSTFNTPYSETGIDGTPNFGNAALCINGQGQFPSDDTCNWFSAGTSGIVRIRSTYFFWQPKTTASLFGGRNIAYDTNLWWFDYLGNFVGKGTTYQFGINAATSSNGIGIANTWGVYGRNAANNANLRMLYLHSDNVLHVGDTVNQTKMDGPITLGNNMRTGGTGNVDTAGTITLSSGTGSFTFTGSAFATSPVCTCTDTTSAAAVKCSATTTTLSITGTGTDVIAYHCIGRT